MQPTAVGANRRGNAMPKKMRMKEVCDAARVGPDTIRRWVRNNQFPGPIRLGRTLLFDAAEVEAALRPTAEKAVT